MALLLVALIPTFGLAIFHAFNQFQNQKNAIAESTLQLTRLISANQQHDMDHAKEFLTAIAHFEAIRGNDVNRCTALLNTLAESFDVYTAFGRIGVDGNLFCSSSQAILRENSLHASFLKQALATRSFTFGPYEIEPMTGKPIAFASLPILDESKRSLGVVYAVLDLTKFDRMPAAMQLPQDAMLSIFDQNGLILGRFPDPKHMTGKRIPRLKILEVVKENPLEGIAELVGMDGMRRLFAYHLLHDAPDQQVYVTIGIATETAYVTAKEQLTQQLISLIIVYLLVAGVVWIGSDKLVVEKMRSLNKTAKSIAEGQLATRSNIGGENEVGQLARAVDEMAQATQYRVDALQKYNLEMYKLKEMHEALQGAIGREEVFAIVRRFSQELFPNWSGGLYWLREDGDSAEIMAQWGEASLRHAFLPEECWAMRRAKTYFTSIDSSEPRCKHSESGTSRSFICAPLVAQGEILGILHLQSTGTFSDHGNRSDLLSMLQSIAEYTALTLANLELREKLQVQAVRDSLTGLFNRRHMEETLIRETLRAERNGTTISVIMIDIDHFKRFNDTFGHAAGDALLRELGRLLERYTRGSDLACRYGGEEFTVILPGSSLTVAQEIAEVLRENVQKLEIKVHGQSVGKVTISLGVACYPKHGSSWEDMLHSADLAMLEAKQVRNRVVVA
jgi:diguanylate cyclase (GGDEF)-like protein